ncbi:hypothetical protein FNV43_RR15182 [Rhamnella rubrinervis]|uniref:Glycosyltransferase n=1 Tax=Rhamnella rubrinervis TaxID=2594499 RepID=A0A8K0E887_9ROSA|nr:hypothetical protein FNV43_RR15182 [Rhamnella rubrinervis]
MEQIHVVLHPAPLQGHIKPMLCLAQLLSKAGFHATFLVTHHTFKLLPDLTALSANFPNLHFQSISDGLPEDHSRALEFGSFSKIKPYFKHFLLNYSLGDNSMSPPLTCIITDQYLPYTLDTAKELGIPIFSFVSHSACYLLAYLNISKLIEQGDHIPFPDDNMNQEINGVAGLEGLLRRKHLPSYCALKDIAQNPQIQSHLKDIFDLKGCCGLIINTFDELEITILPQVATHFQKVYKVGPLHALSNSKINQNLSHLVASHASRWQADQSCIAWLDSQPLRSVLYVSFGSHAKASVSQILEFWHGLVNSGKPFLWVLRPDVIIGEDGKHVIPKELHQVGAKENGFLVDWAPQEHVLAHHAIGGFLTHCGWNSILESIVAKIPLICWSYDWDQMINAELVSKVLEIGLQLDACDRLTIQRTVQTMMGSKREELQNSIERISECAQHVIGNGGSSNQNLETLVEDIKNIKLNSQHDE